MKKNVGTAERIIRLIVASIIVVFYVTGLFTGPVAIALMALAIVSIFTGIFAVCPLYKVTGHSSKWSEGRRS